MSDKPDGLGYPKEFHETEAEHIDCDGCREQAYDEDLLRVCGKDEKLCATCIASDLADKYEDIIFVASWSVNDELQIVGRRKS